MAYQEGYVFHSLGDRILTGILLALFFVMAGAPRVAGGTLSVPGSAPTIKGAMLKAKPGDIILVSCGTYNEHDIHIKSGVALWSGTLQPDCVTIDAGGRGRALIFADADTNTAVVGLTLTGARVRASDADGTGGAILCRNSSPRISNCVIRNNEAHAGGGLYADAASAPVVENCLFQHNTAMTYGGAVAWECAEGVIRACSLKQNVALHGGGLASLDGAHARVAGSVIVGNEAGNSGGGVYFRRSSGLVTGTVLAHNAGGLGGGAVACVESSPTLDRCTVFANIVEFTGAAVACIASTPQLFNCILANHPSAVVVTDQEMPTLTGCNLFGNAGGDWSGLLASQRNQRRNLSADPRFCAPEYGNFYLNGDSDCLPANNPSGNDSIIGAHGAGCAGETGIEQSARDVPGGFRAVQAGF